MAELASAARRVRTNPGHKRRMVKASIVEYGILNPLAVNAAGMIVDGHLRYEIAVELGLQTVPVIRIEHLSEAELRAYAIAADKLPSVAIRFRVGLSASAWTGRFRRNLSDDGADRHRRRKLTAIQRGPRTA